MVLPHHGLRRGVADRLRPASRLAGARANHAAQLDRQEYRRGGGLPARRAAVRPAGDPDLHHPPGYDLRRDLYESRAGVAAGRAAGRGPPGGKGRAGVRRAGLPTGEGAADRSRPGERRSLHRRLRREPLHAGADSDLGGELRPVRVRDRRDHGGAGARPARLRVRQHVRNPGPVGHSEPGRHAP